MYSNSSIYLFLKSIFVFWVKIVNECWATQSRNRWNREAWHHDRTRKFEFFWMISILSSCLESNILYCVLECKLWDEKFRRNFQTQENSTFVLILGLLAVLIIRYKSAVAMTSCMTNFRLFRWFKRNCIRFWLIFLACHSFFTPFDKSWR